MRVRELDVSRAADWNDLVAAEGSFALTQAREWGAFKARLGWRVRRIGVEDGDGRLVAGAQLLIKPLPLGLTLAYVPRGPVGRWHEPEVATLLLARLERCAQAEGAVFLKLEPAVAVGAPVLDLLARHGFRESRVTNQPRTTMLLDVSGAPEDVLGRMRKKTRQYVRRAEREGITTRLGATDDLSAFHDLMRKTARREGFAPRSLAYHQAEWDVFSAGGLCALLLAHHEGRLIAVRTVHRFGRHAAEFHGGSVTTPGLHPNHLLVWRAVEWAREHGCTTYDLWGIPDEVEPAADGGRPEAPERRDGLWGVYRFKRGFGADVVRYAGAYDLVLKPRAYSVLTAAMIDRSLWERAAARLDRVASSTIFKGAAP